MCVATAYNSPDGHTSILSANEALFFGKDMMENSLISPQQLHDNGLRCDTTPMQYNAHSIHGIHDPISDTTIRFRLVHGCISYIPIRLPTERIQGIDNCIYLEYLVINIESP